jgi:hypothetical protein
MAASLDDILTTQKNGVVAINNLSQANLKTYGTITSVTVNTTTSIASGTGYIVNFAVVVAGTTPGLIYDSASASTTPANKTLCAAPNTIGVYQTGQFFTSGLVIVPGTGQSINITYSMG